jgi:hypothetical protein
MNKKVFVLGLIAMVVLFGSASFGSAAPLFGGGGGDYYGRYGDYVDGYEKTSTRIQGYANGPLYEDTKGYAKVTTSGFLRDGSYQRTTVQVRTRTESPYSYGYYGNRPFDFNYGYPGRNTGYGGYGGYGYGGGYSYGYTLNDYPRYGGYFSYF